MVRVRFAPSPTGHLHVGGLRAALFNLIFARKNKGKFLLRIEDTDVERSKEEYTAAILASLKWCDIIPDEPILIQSTRIAEHRALAEKLITEKKAYRCFCTPEEIKARNEVRFGKDIEYSKYDQKCRSRTITEEDKNKSSAIRFKIPDHQKTISFTDLIRGQINIEADQLDDFIILRSDGMPMYNFVVVADDHFMNISHIIRGEEHISNTPKQILLYQACGFEIPQFAHLPMILNQKGQKLSKRDGATSVIDYKDMGYLPEALCNYLSRLGWGHEDQEIFSREELISLFSFDQISKKGAIFDPTKLNWLNGVYIRTLSEKDILYHLHQLASFTAKKLPLSEQQVLTLISWYRPRVQTLVELEKELISCAQGPEIYHESDIAQWINASAKKYVTSLLTLFELEKNWSKEQLEAAIKSYAHQENEKLVNLAQPIRIALTGKAGGPGLYELLTLIGKEEVLKRIQLFINFLSKHD